MCGDGAGSGETPDWFSSGEPACRRLTNTKQQLDAAQLLNIPKWCPQWYLNSARCSGTRRDRTGAVVAGRCRLHQRPASPARSSARRGSAATRSKSEAQRLAVVAVRAHAAHALAEAGHARTGRDGEHAADAAQRGVKAVAHGRRRPYLAGHDSPLDRPARPARSWDDKPPSGGFVISGPRQW